MLRPNQGDFRERSGRRVYPDGRFSDRTRKVRKKKGSSVYQVTEWMPFR